MSEALNYHQLIKEAFIDPIRTVTVIDDEYPTLKELLISQNGKISSVKLNKKLSNQANINKLIETTTYCHENMKWNLDVFDGSYPDMVPSHISHSDLIVLDYHLDGEPENDNGEKARDVINSLSNNNHYNIVVVHTNGDDSESPLKDIFFKILNDFEGVYSLFEIPAECDDLLEEHFDEEKYDFIENNISVDEIFMSIKYNLTIEDDQHPLNPFVNDIKKISSLTSVSLEWTVKKVFKESLKDFKDKKDNIRDNLSYSWGDDVNFISTGRVFITVVKKEDDTFENGVLEKLKTALFALNTPPMQLLISRIRYELDDRGIIEASKISDNNKAQIGWLKDMFQADEDDDFKHYTAIKRYWEQLSEATKDGLISFSKKTYKILKNDYENSEDLVNGFFPGLKFDELELVSHLNSFVCSTSINSSHLNTGTVLELDTGKEKEYWVCLTPACDLVPSQSKKRWMDRLGENHSAFQAVKLIREELPTAKKGINKLKDNINRNEHLFLMVDDEIKVFRFTKDEKTNPIWETFYALDNGRFEGKGILKFQHLRLRSVGRELTGEGSALRVHFSNVKEMKAVASLRYEYALNLLQKFGSNQSRVGLDFISSLS